jgi:PAS domain S-box-containing protein
VQADDLQLVGEKITELLEGREQRNSSRNRNLHKDGSVLHCSWQNSVLRDADGQIVSILSLVQDVSEQVAAEQTIRENERLYHTMVEATNTGYVQLDEQGTVLEANAEYARLTGRDRLEEILGSRCTEWTALHHFQRKEQALRECLETGSTRNFELDYVTPDGRHVPVEVNACVVHLAQERRIIAFCRDISERRRAEQERKEIERKLQEAQKLESLGVLAGGIAHDFNNLLTGVLGNASLASADLGPGSPVQPYLEQIETAAIRAADLCKQMLALLGQRTVFHPASRSECGNHRDDAAAQYFSEQKGEPAAESHAFPAAGARRCNADSADRDESGDQCFRGARSAFGADHRRHGRGARGWRVPRRDPLFARFARRRIRLS